MYQGAAKAANAYHDSVMPHLESEKVLQLMHKRSHLIAYACLAFYIKE